MRASVGFSAPATIAAATTSPPSSLYRSSAVSSDTSWRSPVPYLFGGLAAMLGLIAFALLILACSYWKLSGYLDGGDEHPGDVEGGGGADGAKAAAAGEAKPHACYEQRIVVIMAGDEKPTFLATPSSSRSSSFGDHSSSADGKSSNGEVGRNGNGNGNGEGKPMEGGDQSAAVDQLNGTENLTLAEDRSRESNDQISQH